jgi:hypothetical protein
MVQLRLSEGSETEERRSTYIESLAKCYIEDGRAAEALVLLQAIPQQGDSRLRILCLLADAQVAFPSHSNIF